MAQKIPTLFLKQKIISHHASFLSPLPLLIIYSCLYILSGSNSPYPQKCSSGTANHTKYFQISTHKITITKIQKFFGAGILKPHFGIFKIFWEVEIQNRVSGTWNLKVQLSLFCHQLSSKIH